MLKVRGSSIVVASALVIVSAAWAAAFGEILSSFRAPAIAGKTTTCYGVAYDGQYLWLNCTYTPNGPYVVYRCISRGGSVVSSFNCPFNDRVNGNVSYGMGWSMDGGQGGLDFAVFRYTGVAYIYRTTYTGSIVRSCWAQPIIYPRHMTSVDFDGTYYWVTDNGFNGGVYKLTTAGVCISSFETPLSNYYFKGIAVVGNYLWLSCGFWNNIVKYTTAGSAVASFPKPGGNVYDCEYANGRLWVVANSQYVFEMSASTNPGIAPASLGRVKAIYR